MPLIWLDRAAWSIFDWKHSCRATFAQHAPLLWLHHRWCQVPQASLHWDVEGLGLAIFWEGVDLDFSPSNLDRWLKTTKNDGPGHLDIEHLGRCFLGIFSLVWSYLCAKRCVQYTYLWFCKAVYKSSLVLANSCYGSDCLSTSDTSGVRETLSRCPAACCERNAGRPSASINAFMAIYDPLICRWPSGSWNEMEWDEAKAVENRIWILCKKPSAEQCQFFVNFKKSWVLNLFDLWPWNVNQCL